MLIDNFLDEYPSVLYNFTTYLCKNDRILYSREKFVRNLFSVTNLDLFIKLHVGVENFASPRWILLIYDLDDFEALLGL